METCSMKIVPINKITPDVLRNVTDKPAWYNFKSGQATGMGIHKAGWAELKKPLSQLNQLVDGCAPPVLVDGVIKQLSDPGVGKKCTERRNLTS